MTTTTDVLFSPITLGDLELQHRATMAPLTRCRAQQPGDVPFDLNATYYAQRANPQTGASLLISEATYIEPRGKPYAFVPGIFTEAQIEGWRLVTDAVHAEGGKILLQLWHGGRIGHDDISADGLIAPSAIKAEGATTFVSAESGMIATSMPRAMTPTDIVEVVGMYRQGAQNAKAAGFDGVEVHGANGYLLDQFLQSSSNQRDDGYGGPIENRARFCLEVTEAVADVWGAGRVGYRISPLGSFNGMAEANRRETWGYLAEKLGAMGLAYLHAVELDASEDGLSEESQAILSHIRECFKNAGGAGYIGCGGLTFESASQRISDGLIDVAAFGKLFLSNPDLTKRMRAGGPYNDWDNSTFYASAGGELAKGYTDYPALT
ncbi:MAG: alkene reductase [Planctomycetota bacterium]